MSKPKKEVRQEVIKHSAAIQIENNITLLQRRTWNALLFHAYNELKTQEEHRISFQDLARLIGYESHDMEYLKEAAVAMLRCIVQYNVLDKDGSLERWGATALLAQADIQKKGLFTYAYSPELRRRLHNPEMYARLDLDLQRQFDSKYGLALWELCADYLGSGREYGETPFIPLEAFRKLMGVTEAMYNSFKKLNQKVIGPAVAEINRVSDFHVMADYQRHGRKVVSLKFKMRRVALLPEQSNGQGELFSDLDDMPMVLKELKDAGISVQEAWDIWQRGFSFVVDETVQPTDPSEDTQAAFDQYIREKIHLLQRRQASGKVESITGFLIEAIRQNYANPEYEQEQRRQSVAQEQDAKRERERQEKELMQQKAATEKARDKALQNIYTQLAQESPEVLNQAVTALMKENYLFRQFYERDKSALENYRARPMLQMGFNPYLERHDPGRFETVKQSYVAQIAAIESEIASL